MDKEILEILKAMQNQMNQIQDQMSGIHNQINGMQIQMDGMQNQIDGTRNQMSSMQNQMNDMHTDIKSIKETQKEHGDILKQLNSSEKNTQLAHERIDAKLKKIDNGIAVLANEDFYIKTEMISVKEDLKVIKGGKE